MRNGEQLNLLNDKKNNPVDDDWTFYGASTRELTHCYHDYPARMIPQIAGRLLNEYGIKAKILLDPYCGTGTSLVESLVRGINAIGTDLNPLARLIARTKTTPVNIERIEKAIPQYTQYVIKSHNKHISIPTTISGISRLSFWFKGAVIEKLLKIKTFIESISDGDTRQFFEVAFSETVRESSNTRSGEFKLYRYDEGKLAIFNPDVFRIMSQKLLRNRAGLRQFLKQLACLPKIPSAAVYDFNTVDGIPAGITPKSSIDIVITSPPYGDSHTTVAYGQYSRLSAVWLGLSDPEKTDRRLMGGRSAKILPLFNVEPLDDSLREVAKADAKRAREVASFYTDLQHSILNIAPFLRQKGYACYVVGNRKVKGVILPTDLAIRAFFENYGFEYIDTFKRSIPNKRMPLKNSPTNASGAVDTTMTKEFIVVMRKL